MSRWSIESGELWTTTISDESLKFNTIHPKGDLWASGYDSGDIRIWDLLHHQHGIPELARITALACSDNYKWLICGDVMGQIHIWHSNSQFHKSLPVFDAAIQSLAMTPTEELHVHLIDGSTYQWQQRSNISKHPAKYSFFSTRYQHWIFLSWNAQITTVTLHGEECYDHPREGFLSSFSHCEDLLFLGFSDGTILIWNWLLRCLQQELQPCKDEILALSYRSPRLCFSTSGGLLAMWNNSIEWQKTYSSQGTSVTFCDDHTVYACFANGQVHLIGQESHIPAIIPKRPTHSILLPGRKLVVATEQQLHFIAAAINPHHKS